VFSNHTGYVFHDSRGIESGGTEELETLREFIRRKCEEKRLRDKLHAIWYCVPMDGHRPELDLKFYENICPDQNVPVIVVFTKYDQFLRNVKMDVSDDPVKYSDRSVSEVANELFQEHYLHPLGDDVRYVQLEKMHVKSGQCGELVEKTAAALNEDAIMLMLLAVQRGNVELSVKTAWRRVRRFATFEVEHVIKECLFAFPYIWLWEATEGSELSFDEESFDQRVSSFYPNMKPMTKHLMELQTIQNLIIHKASQLQLIFAVILILKHATLLRFSNSQKLALGYAELGYQKANIDAVIEQHLREGGLEHSVEEFAGFIMGTDIVSQPTLSG